MIKRRTSVEAPTLKSYFLFLTAISSIVLCGGGVARSAPHAGAQKQTGRMLVSVGGRDSELQRRFRSQHFLLHTDLPEGQALAQLARLESVVKFATEYWRKPSPGIIECYVVDNVSAWPDVALPHRLARVSMIHIGGATVTVPGNSQRSQPQRALFFARAGEGIAEHESVHAYCLQAFGATGPTWYKEGMAEVGCQFGNSSRGVRSPQSYVDYFHDVPRRTIRDIVNQGESTSGISRSLRGIADEQNSEGNEQQVPLASWTVEDSKKVHRARDLYRWNWSLCHFLCHNPNYASRFRRLGQSYLANHNDNFADAFADVNEQAEFEFKFFMQRIGAGYRVDLCSWDWTRHPRELHDRKRARVRLAADRGFQATSVMVSAGIKYDYCCRGKWRVDPDRPATDAAGTNSGRGRLIGVVQTGVELSKPFELGIGGVFTAPANGHLYLRCQDDWTKLADNSGRVLFTMRLE